jgi:hypothetical protein
MGALQFISSVVSSLSWPVLVFILVVVLRKPLSKMLNTQLIRRFEAGPAGVKIEYIDQKLQEVKVELATSASLTASAIAGVKEGEPDSRSNDSSEQDDFVTEITKVAEISPSAAVMESFSRVERALREAVKELGGDGDRASVRTVARKAVSLGIILAPELAAIDDLSAVRNTTAHSYVALDVDRSVEYSMLAGDLIGSINRRMAKFRNSDSSDQSTADE